MYEYFKYKIILNHIYHRVPQTLHSVPQKYDCLGIPSEAGKTLLCASILSMHFLNCLLLLYTTGRPSPSSSTCSPPPHYCYSFLTKNHSHSFTPNCTVGCALSALGECTPQCTYNSAQRVHYYKCTLRC